MKGNIKLHYFNNKMKSNNLRNFVRCIFLKYAQQVFALEVINLNIKLYKIVKGKNC